MIVTAILAIRNEEAYLANCLHHLVHNQINFVIIDNGSNDASAEIYRRREFAAHLVDVKHVPFQGAFSLTEQLQHKLEAVDAVKADWVIHLDADEVMHSYRPDESLSAALSRLMRKGGMPSTSTNSCSCQLKTTTGQKRRDGSKCHYTIFLNPILRG